MKPTAATPPPAKGNTTRPATAGRMDSPLRTMFGLVILWGSLSLIFWAYQLSSNTIQLDISGTSASSPGQMAALVQSLAPRDILMQPCSLNMLKDSSINHLASLAATFKLDLQKNNIAQKLNKTPKAFAFKSIPLFRAIHKLIDNRGVGFAVRGRSILLYEQKLENASLEKRQRVNWEAEMELYDEPLLVFPSGDSDVWFSIQMIRDIGEESNPWRSMQVELWKGAEKQNMIKQPLDAQGKALIFLQNMESVSLQVDRKTAQGNQTPGRYHLIFNFQSND